jgi:hypothetical protein
MQIQAKDDRCVGKRILCNSQVLVVIPGGALCREGETEPAELDPEIAGKLLQNFRAWEPYGTSRARAPRLPRSGRKMQLIDRRGNVLPAEAPEQPPTAAGPSQDVPPSSQAEDPAEPSPEAQKSEVSPSPGEVSGTDPPIPSGSEEWADPDPRYSLDWLRACARAYQIPYGPRTKPETLSQRILAAMYGGEGKEDDGSAS